MATRGLVPFTEEFFRRHRQQVPGGGVPGATTGTFTGRPINLDAVDRNLGLTPELSALGFVEFDFPLPYPVGSGGGSPNP